MADAILSAFIQVAVENMVTLAKDEVGSMLGVRKEIEQLRNTLFLIQGLLRDAEKKEQKSDMVKEWLRMLNDVAFDAEDILDEFVTEALKRRIQTSERKQVCNFLSCATPQNILFQHNMSHKIKEIKVRLYAIANDRRDLQLINGELGQEMQFETKRQRETSSLVDKSHIIGRKEEWKRLTELLVCVEAREKNVSVIPIVGIGGMGKTTLAQLVYNDESINKVFGLKIWICVSEDFDVKRLTREIISSATKRRCDLEQLDVLQRELKEILSRERFLLVLDDVWNEKYDEWEKLRVSLMDGLKGSTVVVTTRNESVSTLMGTIPFIKLEGLSEEDCLSLFKQRAFGKEGLDQYPELEDIGKEIVRKCKGLPLAVKTLGGILATKRDAREWRNILESEIWDSKGSDEIIPSLKLSYNHLSSSHLKQCFAYCSLFPKDHEFDKKEMTLLWMGEGLIQPKHSEQLEDTSLEYFNELVSIGFLEFSYSDEFLLHDLQWYKMHDLVHDLAQFVAKGVYVTQKNDKSCIAFENARHLSVARKVIREPLDFGPLFNCKSLRTILSTYQSGLDGRTFSTATQSIPRDVFLKLRCLRVLNLSGSNIKKLPDSMGKLKHLRYLNLSGTYIQQLPQSVTTLFNLQTLLLDDCDSLFHLPKDTKNLINLRHLSLVKEEFFVLPPEIAVVTMPPEIGKLTSLQTLNPFGVGKTSGNGIEQLKNLVNLRELGIARLENVVNGEMAKEADLKKKQHLDRLYLKWTEEDRGIDNDGQRNDEEVLEALQPHSNLKTLRIEGYKGSSFPSWIGNSSLLSNLAFLFLLNCDRCRRLPALGQLHLLKELRIEHLNGVEHVGREFVGKIKGFISLELLFFINLNNIKEWSDVEEGDFPKLRTIEFHDCPILSIVPKRFESLMSTTNCPLLTKS